MTRGCRGHTPFGWVTNEDKFQLKKGKKKKRAACRRWTDGVECRKKKKKKKSTWKSCPEVGGADGALGVIKKKARKTKGKRGGTKRINSSPKKGKKKGVVKDKERNMKDGSQWTI